MPICGQIITSSMTPENLLDTAMSISLHSKCLNKRWGSLIVSADGTEILSGGYNDAPEGRKTCKDIGSCYRVLHNIPRGTRYETCRSLHSEMAAIIGADPVKLKGATLYLYGYDVVKGAPVENPSSCTMCRRAIIECGIKNVIVPDSTNDLGYKVIPVQDWIDNDETLTNNVGY